MKIILNFKYIITLSPLISGLFFSNLIIAQYPKPLYSKTIDIANVEINVKRQFINEINNSTKYDSSLNFIGVDSSLKRINFSDNNISLSLLNFEQDFDKVDSFSNNYRFLVSIFSSETGHGVKIVTSSNYILNVVVQEMFEQSELTSFQSIHKKNNFYDDITPWRNFKSYKRTIQLGKLLPLHILNQIN